MIYNVTSDFTRLNVTSGTIQNNSYVHSVEVSDTAQAGTGIILRPLNKFTFANQTLYVRCAQGGWAEINVVPFIVDAQGGDEQGTTPGGGGSSGGQTVPENQIATDEDIQRLIDDVFG